MAERRDHSGLDGGELEHGWAGAVEIDTERPSTGLAPDPGFRKWALLGVGASGLLTGALVLFAMHDDAPAAEPQRAAAPTDVEPAPIVAESPSVALAQTPAPASPHDAASSATLAAGSSAAVQTNPDAPKPTASPSKPAPAKAPPPPVKPAAAPVQPAPAKPAPAKPAPAKPEPTKPEPAKPAPAQPDATPLPDVPPNANDADLPDVEGWDAADDEALREQDSASTPS